MKKKVKKIPKYAEGKFYENADFYSQAGNFITQQIDNVQQSKQGVTAGGVVKGMAAGASSGAAIGSIVPVIGPGIGAAVGGAIGGITAGWGGDAKVNVDSNSVRFSDLYTPKSGIAGLWHSSNDERELARLVQNTNIAKIATEQMKHKYHNQPNIPFQPMVNAAEGGIMRKPVDALVSKGELIYDPVLKKLIKIPGNKGKANTKDDVHVTLHEGDIVTPNSPDSASITIDDKTLAMSLEPMVDKPNKKMSQGTIEARDRIVKKWAKINEARKNKSQNLAMYDEGTDRVVYDPKRANDLSMLNEDLSNLMNPVDVKFTGRDPLKNLTKDQRSALRKAVNEINGKQKGKWLSDLADYVPSAFALLEKPSYHKEQTYINPVKYVSTGVSIDPIRRATDEGMAIARYNQMNMNASTGASMAHGLQAAVNRTKSLSNAYKWQQDAQNKLIAQNIGIYNDWSSREAQARHLANTETQQNEAAAQLMKDQRIKDAYEFQTGRRNDRWKLSMLEPLFKYAVDDNIWKNFKMV